MKRFATLLAAISLAALIISSGTTTTNNEEIDTANDSNAQNQNQTPEPNPALKSSNVLVGTWDVARRDFGADKDIREQVNFEWMDGFFLI